jgi:hypothetical protein
MKRMFFAIALAVFTAPALATDVGVSIHIGDPNFYGRIDIGDFPRPRVIYREPVLIERVRVERGPLYLRVPPGHAKNWRKHCRKYDACGERVYFVQDSWYSNEYAPRYRERQRDRRDHDRDDRDDRKSDKRGGPGNGRHGDDRDRGRDR